MSKNSKPKECREDRETNKSNGNNAKNDVLTKKHNQQHSNNQQNHYSENNNNNNNNNNHLSKNKFAKSSSTTSSVNSNEDWPTINETFKSNISINSTTNTNLLTTGDAINDNIAMATVISTKQDSNKNHKMNNESNINDIDENLNKLTIQNSQIVDEKKYKNSTVNISNRDKINNNDIYRDNDSKNGDINGDILDGNDKNSYSNSNGEEKLKKEKAKDSYLIKDNASNSDHIEDESTTDYRDDLNSSSGGSASGGGNDNKESNALDASSSTGGSISGKKKGTKWRTFVIEPQSNKRDHDRRRGTRSYRRRGSSLSASENTETRRYSNNNNNSNFINHDHTDENTLSNASSMSMNNQNSNTTKPLAETKSYRGSRRGRGRYPYTRSHYQRTRSYDYDASIQIDTTNNVQRYNGALLECEGDNNVPLQSPTITSTDYKSIKPYIIAAPALQPTNVPYYLPGYQAYTPSPVASLSPVPIDVYNLIRSQVEYYFSEENLQRDFFLRRKMDSEGYLPIHLIASFQRVLSLTQDLNVLISALRASKEIEFSEDCMRIRTNKNPLQWPVNDTLSGRELNPPENYNGYIPSSLHPDVPAFIPGQPYGYGYDGAPMLHNAYSYKGHINDNINNYHDLHNEHDSIDEHSQKEMNTVSDDGIDGDNDTDNDTNESKVTKNKSVSCYADIVKVNKPEKEDKLKLNNNNHEIKKDLVNQNSKEVKLMSSD